MCDIKEGFKLCTCKQVDETQTHWKLLRFKDEMTLVLGQINPDYYEELRHYDWINSELNSKHCFDFDYTPQDGDRLMIELKQESEFLSICFDFIDNESIKEWQSIDLFDNDGAGLLCKGEIENGTTDSADLRNNS